MPTAAAAEDAGPVEKPGPARLRLLFEKEIAATVQEGAGASPIRWKCRAFARSPSTWVWAKPPRTRSCSTQASKSCASITGSAAGGDQGQEGIATFKLREGQKIRRHGCSRRCVARPHVRILRSAGLRWRCRACVTSRAFLPKAFDGRGNYSLRHPRTDHLPRDQLLDQVDKIKGAQCLDRDHRAHRRPRSGTCCGRSGCRSGACKTWHVWAQTLPLRISFRRGSRSTR